MPPAGARLTLATLLGAADASVIESVEDDVVVLSDSCGLHEGASASTRIYDGERVWHLTFRVRACHELAPRQARVALKLCERVLLGEERSLPRVACRLAATAKRAGDAVASAWASVVDVSQGGLALRAGAVYGAGDLVDVDLDDGTGAVISARVEVVDQTDGLARGRDRRRRRRRGAPPGRAGRPPAQLAERRRRRSPSRCPHCARRWPPLAASRG